MNIIIRELEKNSPEDQQILVELINQYAEDAMGSGQPLSPTVKQRLGPAFASHPTTFALVVEADDQPCGIALCLLGFSSFYAMPLVNIHDFAVIPAMRGKGIGQQLMQAVFESARARGACKVTLEVRQDNAVARHVYEAAAFQLSGLRESPYLMMEKILVKPQ